MKSGFVRFGILEWRILILRALTATEDGPTEWQKGAEEEKAWATEGDLWSLRENLMSYRPAHGGLHAPMGGWDDRTVAWPTARRQAIRVYRESLPLSNERRTVDLAMNDR